jgi:hypothetical protein
MLQGSKAKMNKSKINNNNNKTNTKHEFNVKYERYKQDISKGTLQMQKKSEKIRRVEEKEDIFENSEFTCSCKIKGVTHFFKLD